VGVEGPEGGNVKRDPEEMFYVGLCVVTSPLWVPLYLLGCAADSLYNVIQRRWFKKPEDRPSRLY